jgi:hypothetical protein
MKISIEITDVSALTADERLALLTLMQIRTNERPADRVARAVAASPAVPAVATPVLGVPIADADRPDAGQVPVPDRMPQSTAGVIEQPAAIDTAKLFGAAQAQPAAAVPIVPAVPTIPAAAVPVPPAANVSASAPAVPAAVPVPPAGDSAAVSPPAPTGALDAQGLPWDQRIHASTKAKNADGTWRQKRGVDAALVEQVTASLRSLVAIPAVPAPVPPAGARVAVPGITYVELMHKAIDWTSSVPQKISMPQIFEVIKPMGLNMLPDLQHRPDMVQAVHDAIEARIAASGQ